MNVNVKKSLNLPTKTVFFDPSKDRVKNSFSSSNSFSFRKQRIEGYECRLYWQFLYCQSINMPVFFYTLTYSDKNVPSKYGVSCFDYEDLRDFLTGGFRKMLLRKYGVTFKYFVGAELGEGKGKRGLHNNPHYHILFFFEPANNPDFPLRSFTPEDFRHLVRLYWQGFDEDSGFKLYKNECKFGIAKEGENIGLVSDYRACFYCAKYVSKDVKLKMKEFDIPKLLRLTYKNELLNDASFHRDFFNEVICPLYNIRSSFSEYKYSVGQLLSRLLPNVTSFFDSCAFQYDVDEFFDNDETFIIEIKLICKQENLWKEYYQFLNKKLSLKIDEAVKEWRNRFSNKVRISHGVGDYALDFIDPLEPLIKVPSKNGFKYRSPSLYYYRKLYTGIVKPFEKMFNGSFVHTDPVRVLTQQGIDYKVKTLESRLSKKALQAENYFSALLNNKDLYELMRSSDVNTDVKFHYEDFVSHVDNLKEYIPSLFRTYALYKIVYQYRYFEVILEDGVIKFPVVSPELDYRRFLLPSVFSVPRSDLRVEEFLSDSKNYMSYDFHPFFLKFLMLFQVLDLSFDYFFVCIDNEREEEYKKIKETKSFHVLRNLLNL